MGHVLEDIKKYDFNGESLTMLELAIKYDTTPMTIYMRLRRGASLQQAVMLKKGTILFSEQEKQIPVTNFKTTDLIEKKRIFQMVYVKK